MDAGIVFRQMLVLLAMMVLGYLSYKKQWMKDETAKQLSILVLNIFNPALIIGSVSVERGTIGRPEVAENLILIAIYFGLLYLISFPLIWLLRPAKNEKAIYRVMTMFSNLGFMAIPVIRSVYGNGAVLYVAFYILVYNVLLYTYGYALAKRAGMEERLYGKGEGAGKTEGGKGGGAAEAEDGIKAPGGKRNFSGLLGLFWNPGVIASAAAIMIFFFNIPMPEAVTSFCDYVGNTTTPLSMMLIGVSVAQADMGKLWRDKRVYLFILLRMVFFPGVLALIGKGLPLNRVIFGVFIIECCMPVGSIVTLMMKNNGAQEESSLRGTLISTLISVITIPVVCALL